MNKTNGRRRKKNNDKVISIRLTDADGDLADWWDLLPEGERSQAVKELLRAHIGAQKPDPMAPIREAIQRMDDYLHQLASQGVMIGRNGTPEQNNELDPDDARRRAQRILKNKW